MISLSALMFVRSTHSFCLVFDELMKEGAPSGLTSQTPSDQSRSFSLSQNHTHTRRVEGSLVHSHVDSACCCLTLLCQHRCPVSSSLIFKLDLL